MYSREEVSTPSSRVSSWWYLWVLSRPRTWQRTLGHKFTFHVTFLWVTSLSVTRASHLITRFLRISWLIIAPRFLFPWCAPLSLHLMPVLPYSLAPLWYVYAFQCHLQRLSVPFEHSPRWRGERGRLEWHHSWKTSRRWKMSMNSRLFSGSLNSTYVLVPDVIHKTFWTFRAAKPIGNQSWMRRIRWNTAVGGHMSLCPSQSWSLLAKLCE